MTIQQPCEPSGFPRQLASLVIWLCSSAVHATAEQIIPGWGGCACCGDAGPLNTAASRQGCGPWSQTSHACGHMGRKPGCYTPSQPVNSACATRRHGNRSIEPCAQAPQRLSLRPGADWLHSRSHNGAHRTTQCPLPLVTRRSGGAGAAGGVGAAQVQYEVQGAAGALRHAYASRVLAAAEPAPRARWQEGQVGYGDMGGAAA
jgi:hypothetical protein